MHSHSMQMLKFLSTLPARGATRHRPRPGLIEVISIHAPREGSDDSLSQFVDADCHFYPRSPRGERPSKSEMVPSSLLFLSTLPARGATSALGQILNQAMDFYPRSPRGERPLMVVVLE